MRAIAICCALALTGCAHSELVLLPDEDGGQGEVAIVQPGAAGGEVIVSEANSRTTLDTSRPSTRPLGAKGLKADEAALLASLPPPPSYFTLYFHEGTTRLTAASATHLEALRTEVARRPGAEVQVTGHTDTVGSDADNDVLSRKRAEEVLRFLSSQGFDRAAMRAVGRGERQLEVATGDNVSNAVNRRVEVIVR